MKKQVVVCLGMVSLFLLLTLMPVSGAWAQELAEEQTVRLAMGVADIGTLDPHFATKIGEYPVVTMIYEALLRHPPGQIDIEKIQPSLAERWEVAEDKLTWTFHLRKGVRWHGGYGEFTAEDVKFSLGRVMDPDIGSPARKRLPAMESITIVDPYTIQIKTQKILPDLPALLVNEMPGYVMCKKAVQKLGKDIKYQPIGTGPFMFSSYKPR
ncbi:MAG: ABC transporter substrate-binding protein, partial [Desulfobacterales bacterium]